jgi:hypothetical protein
VAAPSFPLLPAELVSSWRSLTEAAFLREVGEAPVLLIDVSESEDLTHGLEAASTASGEKMRPHKDSLGFRTEIVSSVAVLFAKAAERRRIFEARLQQAPHYIVPLRKRAGVERPFADRVFVGRAHSTDVVLRDSSVSKSHAWIECDTEGTYFVCDAGSKNGTTQNGNALTEREPSPLEDDDQLVFGDVRTFFCTAPSLWALLKK